MIKSSQSNNKLLPVVQSFPFSKIFVKIFLFHFGDTTCFWKKSMLIIFRPVQSWSGRSSPESISVQSIPLHMSRRGTGPYFELQSTVHYMLTSCSLPYTRSWRTCSPYNCTLHPSRSRSHPSHFQFSQQL